MRALDNLLQRALDELADAVQGVDPGELETFRKALLGAKRIFVTGKGRSGLQMRGFAMRLMHLGRTVFVVDDVTTPASGRGDMLVIGSGSGRTPSLVAYAKGAKREGAKVALLTIAAGSSIAPYADVVVHIPAATPKLPSRDQRPTVLPMGASFELALALLLDLVTLQLMDETGVTSERMFERHANLE
jgi:6-phospho-3-hexuloisomerase